MPPLENQPKCEIGSEEGLIGILTKGKIDRKEYSKQAILMAFQQLEKAALYQEKALK